MSYFNYFRRSKVMTLQGQKSDIERSNNNTTKVNNINRGHVTCK